MDEYGFGSRGPGVQLLQLGLSRAGYQPGRIDGSFGRGTENALRQFQQAQGLPATGRSDAATWQAMMPWLIGTRFVQLRQGDTFWRLSQQYDTSVAAISAANPELDPRDLRPGQTVAIPLDFPVVPTGIAFTSQVLELTLTGLLLRYPYLGSGAIGSSNQLIPILSLVIGAVIGELLDHDLPVFTELNLVSDGYRENMVKAAAKKLPLFLSSTMLYRRETQYIKQQVAEFGKPVHYIYHIGQYLPDWHPWENYKNFFVGNARTGGVREIFGIDLPWLLDAFGDVESVTVQKDTLSDLRLPYPDSVTLLLRHKGGVQGVLAADVVSRKAVRSFECFGDGIHLFWEGNPKALYEFKDGDKRFVNTYASFEHDSRYSDNVVENAYVDELTNFFGVLKGDEQPKWSFEKDLKAIELMDKIEKA